MISNLGWQHLFSEDDNDDGGGGNEEDNAIPT